jgi:hypothetical protein
VADAARRGAEHCRAYIVNLQKCGFSLLVVMDGTVNEVRLLCPI